MTLDIDLRQVRRELGLTRAEFAAALNTPIRTLEAWESGRTHPPGCLLPALKYVAQQKSPPGL